MHPFRRAMHWASERRGLAWIDVGHLVEAALRTDGPLASRLRARVVPSALPPIPEVFRPHHRTVFTIEARGFLERVAGRNEERFYEAPVPDALLVHAARFDLGREALALLGLEGEDVEAALRATPRTPRTPAGGDTGRMNDANPNEGRQDAASPGDLAGKVCEPCKGDVDPFTPEETARFLTALTGWKAVDNHHLVKRWTTPDFVTAEARARAFGAIAEAQNHHPVLEYGWGYVEARIWTHKLDGLALADFVLAAKFDRAQGEGEA